MALPPTATSLRIGIAVPVPDMDLDAQFHRLQSAGCREVRLASAGGLDAELHGLLPGSTAVLVSLGLLGPPLRIVVTRVCALLDAGVEVVTIDEGLALSASVVHPSAKPFRAIEKVLTIWERRRVQKRRSTLTDQQGRAGRKPRLAAADDARVRAMLNVPGATVPRVARELGIGRTTLYRFLREGTSGSHKHLGATKERSGRINVL